MLVERHSKRVLILKMVLDNGLLYILTVYAYHSGKTEEEKQSFWNEMFHLVSCIPQNEMVVLAGDMNRHHNTTTSAVHQHITDNYQPAQATSLMATSSHIYCTKTVIEFLSHCDYLLCILLGVSLLSQQCVLSLLILKK